MTSPDNNQTPQNTPENTPSDNTSATPPPSPFAPQSPGAGTQPTSPYNTNQPYTPGQDQPYTQGHVTPPASPYGAQGSQHTGPVPPAPGAPSGTQATTSGQVNPNQSYPYSSYPPQAPYETAPKKAKVWPWVLGGCLLMFVIGIGGCVGCVTCSALLYDDTRYYDTYDDYSYDYDYDYNYDYLDDLYDDEETIDATLTLEEIKGLAADEPSKIEEGKCTTGAFEVGTGKDIGAGLYFLEGNQTEEGSFMVFEKESKDSYTLVSSVVYFGNYYAELESDEVIVFLTPVDAKFYPASESTMVVGDVIESGCYRVGIDIPAGDYTVSYQKGFVEDASQESGVYVMKDLEWDDDSIIESKNIIAGGTHTITAKEGQYVELYGAVMSAAAAPVG